MESIKARNFYFFDKIFHNNRFNKIYKILIIKSANRRYFIDR